MNAAGESEAVAIRWAAGNSRRMLQPPKAPVIAIRRKTDMENDRSISAGAVQNRPTKNAAGPAGYSVLK